MIALLLSTKQELTVKERLVHVVLQGEEEARKEGMLVTSPALAILYTSNATMSHKLHLLCVHILNLRYRAYALLGSVYRLKSAGCGA